MSDQLPDRPGGTSPHVLVDDVERPRLGPTARHHLARVRRLQPGDALSVTDGRGHWRWCGFGEEVEVRGEVHADPAPDPPLTVGFALVKGQRPELVVQKLTEIGIDEIVPFVAERSVVKWDGEKAARHHERLLVIANEAAEQSRRTWFPIVRTVVPFDEAVALPGAVQCDVGGAPLTAEHTTVLIGPEGGWSPAERRPGAVGLGATVLRAETAAIAVAALQVALRDGRVR